MNSTATKPLDVLFVSELPLWPMDQGYRVHGANLARSLKAQGLNVAFATLRPAEKKVPGWMAEMSLDWPRPMPSDIKRFALGWSGKLAGLRERLADHQGLNGRELAGVLTLIERTKPRAVIALGSHGPAILRGLGWAYPKLPRIWYAADEPVRFQLSMLRREGIHALSHRARLATVFGLMQIAFNRGNIAHRLSGVVGVSERDTRWLKRFNGSDARTIPNGVDTDFYQPTDEIKAPRAAVFWGNLAFEPNKDAVRWFAKKVWPHAVYRWPDATWTIMGKSPDAEIREIAEMPGVELIDSPNDIRPHVRTAGAVVLPMRCGHGIKNKLLEAAAMGMPILASPRAMSGLRFGEGTPPMLVCKSGATWVEALNKVWHSPAQAQALGMRARDWVLNRHTWQSAAVSMNVMLQSLAPAEAIYPESAVDSATPETLTIETRKAA